MTFDQFLSAWNRALSESRLPAFGLSDTTLDLRDLDRTVQARVEPLGGQFAEPFHVTAALSFRWPALLTARGATTEEDALIQLFGPDGFSERDTDHPWVRVDITFSATLAWGKPLPMPHPARWAAWAQEVIARLNMDPIVEDEEDDPDSDDLAIGAWQGIPKATFACTEDGSLDLEHVEVESWQAIQVPRHWDDPDREPDAAPDDQLHRMMARVRKALHVWAEVLDQLRPRQGAAGG